MISADSLHTHQERLRRRVSVVSTLTSTSRSCFDPQLRPKRTWPELVHEFEVARAQETMDDAGLLLAFHESVEEVSNRREKMVDTRKSIKNPAGRLFLYAPFMARWGLAAESGVTDGEDAPAWDFWIALVQLPPEGSCGYRHGMLLSWVVPEYYERFEHALRFCIAGEHLWATDPDSPDWARDLATRLESHD